MNMILGYFHRIYLKIMILGYLKKHGFYLLPYVSS